MILSKTFKKKIPSFRHKKVVSIYDNSYIFLKKDIKRKNGNLIKRKKFFYNSYSVNLNKNLFKFNNLVTRNNYYSLKPYKRYIQCQTLDNFSVNIPGIALLNVGKVIYHYGFFKNYKNKFYFKGFITYLYTIPITVIFSNVTNLYNTKITYSKSSGTFCKTRKTKKTKKKLILVILPSKKEVFLTKQCKAYIGKNTNFRVNELIEGKWGFGFHKKKKISVRGVAMNPVDHPNGGRAKTVQPERSPWNWVAKKKK